MWEGTFIVVQFMSTCNLAVSMMRLGIACQPWFGFGLVVMLFGPVLFLVVTLSHLRAHVDGENIGFIRYRHLDMAMIQKQLSFGIPRGISAMILCMRDRGKWLYRPSSRSSIWAFFVREHCGEVWMCAVWKLLKDIGSAG